MRSGRWGGGGACGGAGAQGVSTSRGLESICAHKSECCVYGKWGLVEELVCVTLGTFDTTCVPCVCMHVSKLNMHACGGASVSVYLHVLVPLIHDLNKRASNTVLGLRYNGKHKSRLPKPTWGGGGGGVGRRDTL